MAQPVLGGLEIPAGHSLSSGVLTAGHRAQTAVKISVYSGATAKLTEKHHQGMLGGSGSRSESQIKACFLRRQEKEVPLAGSVAHTSAVKLALLRVKGPNVVQQLHCSHDNPLLSAELKQMHSVQGARPHEGTF